jgi:hypothetical protein
MSAQLDFSNHPRVSVWRQVFAGAGMSHFVAVLLLMTTLMLTLCLGVAAWRVSDEGAETRVQFQPMWMQASAN